MPSYRLLALPSSKNNPIPSSVQNLFLHTFGIAGRESLSLSWTTSRKISASLDSCSDVVTLRKLHARIFTHGFSGDILVGSRLLASYAKFEFLAESRLVFDGIHNANLILWNSLLVKYFKIGHHTEILRFYSNLRQRKIGLDGATITINLKSCIKLGTLEFGRGVHVDAFKFGLSMNKFVGSSLICLYSKYGDIEDAYKIFDEITEKDVVVYTSLVTGYSLVGDHRAYDAFGVVREMLKNQIDPNRVTLVSLLQVAAQLQILIEGRTVHGFAIRRRIGCSDEIFETSLLDMYIKCKATQIADCLFRKLNVRTIGSWNAMIASRLQTKQPLDALHLFILMIQEKVVPDLISLANVIFCFADLKYLRLGKSIHGYIVRSKVQLDLVATSALVDMYSQCNKLVHARKMFERIGTKDVISYNVMMTGYLQNECALEALEIFIEMVGASVRPNQSSILCALNALSDVKQIKQGRCIHGYVLRHGCHTSIEIFNKILNMYANCGHIDYARKVFNMIRYRDLVSWTSMMMGCISHGHADEAIALFQNMKREKLEYDSVALISLLQAVSQLGCLHLVKEVHCHLYRVKMEQEIHVINSLITTYSRSGELGMARNMFESMKKRHLTSWNAMIAAFGMHGKCLDAIKLFECMRKEEIQPDEKTFTSILTACSHSGFIEEGLQVFRSMLEDNSIIPSEEHYGCMVDLLSRAGRLEEAYQLVKCLPSGQSASALGALLAACRMYRNTKLGDIIGRRLLEIEPENSSVYGSISNLYAEGGKWDEVARIRGIAKDIGLTKSPGYSLIEL